MIWTPRELARYERYALKWLPYGGRKRGCVAPRVQEVFSEEGVIQLGPADGCVRRQKAGYGKEEDREQSSAANGVGVALGKAGLWLGCTRSIRGLAEVRRGESLTRSGSHREQRHLK